MSELDNITKILVDVFENETLTATPELLIRELENWDSFNHINFMIAVEDAFQIIIMPKEMESLYTVQDLLALIKEKG